MRHDGGCFGPISEAEGEKRGISFVLYHDKKWKSAYSHPSHTGGKSFKQRLSSEGSSLSPSLPARHVIASSGEECAKCKAKVCQNCSAGLKGKRGERERGDGGEKAD